MGRRSLGTCGPELASYAQLPNYLATQQPKSHHPCMPHIALPEGMPGIRGPLTFRPETAEPMRELAEVLLRGPNTLTRGEREMIADLRLDAQRLRVLPAQSPRGGGAQPRRQLRAG